MQFFDTHAHIGLIYDDPIEQLRVIQQAKQAGVTRIVSISNSLIDFEKNYPNLKAISGIYHAVGVAPSEVTNPGDDYIGRIERYLSNPNVVAVGETGLDYYKQFGDKRSQIELFITQLELAQKHNLPVIIHNRDAGKDIFDVLSDRMPDSGAIFHCYSEDAEYAKKCLDMNVYFSFAGNLTYRNARNLHETVMNIPLDRILLETDAPFILPYCKDVIQPKLLRRARNTSLILPAVIRKIAELKGISADEVEQTTTENTIRLFHLPIHET